MIKTNVADVDIREDGIITMKFYPSAPVKLQDSQDLFNARKELDPSGNKQLLLVDITDNPKPDREARAYAKKPEMNELTKGMAMIIGNSLSRILGNFFLGLNKGEYPVRLFSDETEAIQWLKQL